MFRCCFSKCQNDSTRSRANKNPKSDRKKAGILGRTVSRYRENKEVFILLAGIAEAGKTTFLKQMQIIHGPGFTEDDRRSFKGDVFRNINQAMRTLLFAMEEREIPLENSENQQYAELLKSLREDELTTLPPNRAGAIMRLWQDGGVCSCYRRRREFQLIDSAEYFFCNLHRISMRDYTPDRQDVLRVRKATSGIQEFSFTIDNYAFRMLDVGGQRDERHNWLETFLDATSVIFLASLSDFDQRLEEDPRQDRLQESLSAFSALISNKTLSRCSFILFLNKMDLLEKKLKDTRVADYYPEYKGFGNDLESVKEFLYGLYQERVSEKNVTVYRHFTNATDTTQITFVFAAVRDTILCHNLEDYGLI